MTLGEKIQILRKQRGMSQEQLGEMMNISRQAVSKWELGESIPDVDNIVQLSELFNVTTDFLLKNAKHHQPEQETEERSPLPKISATPRQNYIFARTLFIAGGIGLIMSSISGLLWNHTADILFAASLYVVVMGLAGSVKYHLHKATRPHLAVIPPLAILGAKIILGCFIVISIGGIQGLLNRGRAFMLLDVTWVIAVAGNILIIYSNVEHYLKARRKTIPEVVDLRSATIERDEIEWKN